jgi:glycosyltransferase involved in cell wall biosynthesis
MKVAIVCDWLTEGGGAERVVLELHKIFPEAPIYTSQYAPSKLGWFKEVDVRTTGLQKLPKALRKFLPPLRAWTFSRLDLSDYDLVISSSGAEAKGVKTGPKTTHIAYIHSPTHYYWIRYDEYLKNPGFGKLDPLARIGLKLLVNPLRKWDYKAAQRPDHLIANSTHTQAMIKKYYGRDSTVIHPPVDIKRFTGQAEEPRKGFITAGRQTPYKRIDLPVRACTELGLNLIVLGNGPDNKKLKKLAGKTVTFLRDKDDEELAHYFKSSEAFIFPNMDDFGIVAVEALAAGTPVIAYKAGGALDYIEDGQNGLFFAKQDAESLKKILQNFNLNSFNSVRIQQSAAKFSIEEFHKKIKELVAKNYKSPAKVPVSSSN